MQVTDVKVYPTVQGTLRAYADITIDNSLFLRKLKLFRNPSGYMLCMPNGQTDGSFREMAYPAANDETLKLIQDAVVAEYKKVTGPRTRSKRRVWLPTYLRLVLLLLIHISVLATANADNESESGKPSVFSDFNAGSITGLDFPGSAGVKATMRFKFTNPHNNGLPIYGVGGRGVTYIWRAYPRQQDGYYTAFFWGNDDGQNNLNTFRWKSTNGNSTREADTYYGTHPYPRRSNRSLHDWEISVEEEDYVNGQVVYDRWYTQALRVWSVANRKFHEFYWDLPNTDPRHLVSHVSPGSWGTINPPAPALTWGDAPWAPGKEVWKGILRGIQIYSGLLSVSDILREASNPLSTSAGTNNIWYLNMNPTPSDISDKSGRGQNPVWVGNERPGLYVKRTQK